MNEMTTVDPKPDPEANQIWKHVAWDHEDVIVHVGENYVRFNDRGHRTPEHLKFGEFKCVGYQLPDGRRVMVGEERQSPGIENCTITAILGGGRVVVRSGQSTDRAAFQVAAWPVVDRCAHCLAPASAECGCSRCRPEQMTLETPKSVSHATFHGFTFVSYSDPTVVSAWEVRRPIVASAEKPVPGKRQLWKKGTGKPLEIMHDIPSAVPLSVVLADVEGYATAVPVEQLATDPEWQCVGAVLPDGRRMLVGEHWTYVVHTPPLDDGSVAHIHLLCVVNGHDGPVFRVQYGETGGGCTGVLRCRMLADLGKELQGGACMRFTRVGLSPSRLSPPMDYVLYTPARAIGNVALDLAKRTAIPSIDPQTAARVRIDPKSVERAIRAGERFRRDAERAEVTKLWREHAGQHPDFADARLAALAAMDENGYRVLYASSVLDWFLEYENKRGIGKRPSAEAVSYARCNFGEAAMAAYERARGTPVEGLGILVEERIVDAYGHEVVEEAERSACELDLDAWSLP